MSYSTVSTQIDSGGIANHAGVDPTFVWDRWDQRERTFEERWLTTGDVAKMLERSPRAVRWLAQLRRLPGEHTRSGQWLFRPEVIARVLKERADARTGTRQDRLRAVRLRMLKAEHEPRQLSLFRRRKSESVLPDLAVKGPRLVRKSA